jgi:hypothetical protein
VARGLSDHVTDAPVDQAVFALAKPDGSANVGAVARYLVARPTRIVGLARMARNGIAAANAPVDAVRKVLPTL